MKITKTLSTLSLAGILVAVAIALTATDAEAATKRCFKTRSQTVVCYVIG